MQHSVKEIGQINITSRLRICLYEHDGATPRHEYVIEAKENQGWTGKDKSYIKNFDFENQLQVLSEWSEGLISSEEVQKLLNGGNGRDRTADLGVMNPTL